MKRASDHIDMVIALVCNGHIAAGGHGRGINRFGYRRGMKVDVVNRRGIQPALDGASRLPPGVAMGEGRVWAGVRTFPSKVLCHNTLLRSPFLERLLMLNLLYFAPGWEFIRAWFTWGWGTVVDTRFPFMPRPESLSQTALDAPVTFCTGTGTGPSWLCTADRRLSRLHWRTQTTAQNPRG